MKWIIAFACAIALAGGTYVFLSKSPDQKSLTRGVSVVSATSSREVPVGMREYRDEQYHISLLYSESLDVSKRDEGEGAATITFQNADDVKGFQIFVTPYGLPQVTAERTRKDIPSGVREGLRDVTIDSATGATFFSKDEFLGETAEVWFIHEGYLYEVTTLKPLAPWLTDIMATWKFL